MTDAFTPDPEDLGLLTQVVQRVVRAHRLSAADAEDFGQLVHLRLLERDYDILRRFNRQSSLKTYLTVVVVRLLFDWRNANYGKWRPSAAARRLGKHAVHLELLMSRDRLTEEEAIQIAARSPDAPPLAEVRQLASRLPPRVTHRMAFCQDLGKASSTPFTDPIEAAEQKNDARRVGTQLARALSGLPMRDRRLLYLRYVRNRSVHDIAEALQIDRKTLYRQFEASLRRLRLLLAAQGVTRASVRLRFGDG